MTLCPPGVQTDRVWSEADFPAEETAPTFRQRHQQGNQRAETEVSMFGLGLNVLFFTGN